MWTNERSTQAPNFAQGHSSISDDCFRPNGRFSRAANVRSSKRCPVDPLPPEGPYLATTMPWSSLRARGSNAGQLDNRKRRRATTGQVQVQETRMPAPATRGINRIESSSSSSMQTTTTRLAGSRSNRSNNRSSAKLFRPKAYRQQAAGLPGPSEGGREDTSKPAHRCHFLEAGVLLAGVRRRRPGAGPLGQGRTGEATPPRNSSATNKISNSTIAGNSSSSRYCL